MLHRIVAMMSAAATLAGCVSTAETRTAAESQWVGRLADEFFLAYGPPLSVYPLDGGGRLVKWNGGQKTYNLPGWSDSYGSVSSVTGRISMTTYTTPPSSKTIQCEIDIYIDAAGVIQQMRIAKDTIGAWQLS